MSLPLAEVRDDAAILNYIFDPRKTFIGSCTPAAGASPAVAVPETPDSEALWAEFQAVKAGELAAVDLAEGGKPEAALEAFSALAAAHPSFGSVCNNAAQARRIAFPTQHEAIKADLDEAVKRATAFVEKYSGSDGVLSPHMQRMVQANRNVLKAAHTQRAFVHRQLGDAKAEEADLHAAAAYGSTIARVLTTGTNPYATMCNAAVAAMTAYASGASPKAS